MAWERERAADRLAYLLWTHQSLADEASRTDALEDLRRVAPDGWTPPVDLAEAQQRWEAAWSDAQDPHSDLH